MNQGDYTVLGIYADEVTVGHYYFAFMLSTQAMMLVTFNLGGVLTPVLARLQEHRAQQSDRFFEATGLIALAGIPGCFGLALVADPLIRLCFDDRYLPAIPYLQLLSIGMAFRMVGQNGSFLMQANGAWRNYFLLSITNALVFVGVCLAGIKLAGPMGLAVAVTIFYTVFGVTQLAVSTAGRCDGRPRRILGVYGVPLVACVPGYAALAGAQAALGLPPWLALPLLIVLGVLTTLATLRVVFPQRLEHLMTQIPVEKLWRRLRGGGKSAA